MHPILFTWRGIRVHNYPVMLYLGLVFGIIAGNYAANRAGLDSARVLIAMLLLVIPGLVGARLLFVALHWRVYRRERRRIWEASDGGAAMLGGLLPIVVLSVPLLGALEIPLGGFWDVAAFTCVIGLLFARVGCLLHGCCGGRETDGWLALRLPDHRGVWRRRVPTQILEGGLALLLLAGAVWLWQQRLVPGAVFLGVVAAYAGGRLVLQPMRSTQDRLGGLNVHQALSATYGTLALAGLVVAWFSAS